MKNLRLTILFAMLTTLGLVQLTYAVPPPYIKVTLEMEADCNVVTVGQTVTYTINVNNYGAAPLTLVSIIDSLLGDITSQAGACGSIAVGGNCSFKATRVIKADDPSPLENTITVNYKDQFNHLTDANVSASVTVIHPDFTVTNTCTSEPIPVGGPATFTVTIHNTGDVPLLFTTNEAALSDTPEPFTVAVDDFIDLTITKKDVNNPCEDVSNTITVTAKLTQTIACPIDDIVKTSNSATCYCKPTILVTKTADCDDAIPGKVITYTITITNTGINSLTLNSVNDNLLGDITAVAQANGCTTLAGGVSCSFQVTRAIQANDSTTLDNMVSVDYHDAQQVSATDDAIASVTVIHPDFTVTNTCTSEPIPAGGPATFNVVIQNTGDVDLSFTTNEAALSSLAEPFTIPAGATRNLTISIPTSGTIDVGNTITVTASLVDELPCVNFTNNQKTAGDTCHAPLIDGVTRTWGFWKTHTAFTECIFDKCGSSFDLGWRQVTTYAQLFGIFEADNAKNSNGKKRDALCQARVTASHQALAALLNTCLDKGKSLPAGITPASIANTLKNGTVAQINALNSQLDIYNNGGDLVKLSPAENCVQGSATPKKSDAIGNATFADCP
ncbi:MAG: DUF7507 domain-containing protein [Sedimentisphaerales bacterium]